MTRQALLGLGIFLVLVMVYLVVRFEWRMAVAAVSSLLLDLVLTAGVYSLVGFEVTPSTVIGFLTILGFALYDVVVVFDKVQENTRGITAGSTQTYGEATNLAVNQTLMRSINTGLVALLPVGGLLFIGAGLLGAGTLKDLGLVLFVGMGLGVLLVDLVRDAAADRAEGPGAADPGRTTPRVLARRAAARSGEAPPRAERKRPAEQAAPRRPTTTVAGAGAGQGRRRPPASTTSAAAAAAASGRRKRPNRGGRPGGASRPRRDSGADPDRWP